MSVQRTNYFISKSMQGKFAGTVLLLALLVTVITGCNIYVLGSYFYDSSVISASEGIVFYQHLFQHIGQDLLYLFWLI